MEKLGVINDLITDALYDLYKLKDECFAGHRARYIGSCYFNKGTITHYLSLDFEMVLPFGSNHAYLGESNELPSKLHSKRAMPPFLT